MEPRKTFNTQTGIEFNDGTQKHVVGNVRDLASKPLDKDKNKIVSTSVFNMIPEGEPSHQAGDMVTYEGEVEGGLCGVEALMMKAFNHLDDGSAAAQTTLDTFPNANFYQHNIVVPCTEVFIPTGPGEPPGNREDLCLTASEGSAPPLIGEILIHNLGSDLPRVGFTCPERDALNCFERHAEHGFPTDMGDTLYVGVGNPLKHMTDEEQIEYRYSANHPYKDLLCDCYGLPGWMENRSANWAPCEPQGQNTELNPSNPPVWQVRGRTFICTDWLGLQSPLVIPPGSFARLPGVNCSDVLQSACATGVMIKFICGPGEYTKKANSGKKFKPAGAPDSANLYRYIRKPKAKFKIEVFPRIV
jgi:hypothetical protein